MPDLPRECNTQSLPRQGHPDGKTAESVPQETGLVVVCVRKFVRAGLLGRESFGKRSSCWRIGRRNKIAQGPQRHAARNKISHS